MIKFKYRTLFFTVLLIFYTGYLIKNWSILEKSGIRFDPFYLYCSGAVMILFLLVYSFVLWLQLSISIPGTTFKTFTVVQTGAWLSRYIPGMAGVIGGKVFCGSRAGISKEILLRAGFNEQILDFFISLFICLLSCFLLISNQTISIIYTFVILFLIALVILKWNYIITSSFRRMYSKKLNAEDSKKIAMSDINPGRRYLIILFLIISRILYSLTTFFILKSVFLSTLINLKLIVITLVADSLIKMIGQLFIILPFGIAIKEIILFIFLKGSLPFGIIMIGVFQTRLWQTFMDFICFFYYIKHKKK